MATSDTFPVDPGYGSLLTRESNVLRGRVESAREYLRQKAAPRRIWAVVWPEHPVADWQAMENFRHKMLGDFFTFHDKDTIVTGFTGRKYSVIFHGEPTYERAGYETINMRCEIIEQIGAAMATYPTLTGGFYPSINLLTAAAEDLGASGKQWIYPGYGFRVNGTFTTVYLDEVDVTGSLASGMLTAVALGLHRLRVVGGAPTSLDYLI